MAALTHNMVRTHTHTQNGMKYIKHTVRISYLYKEEMDKNATGKRVCKKKKNTVLVCQGWNTGVYLCLKSCDTHQRFLLVYLKI